MEQDGALPAIPKHVLNIAGIRIPLRCPPGLGLHYSPTQPVRTFLALPGPGQGAARTGPGRGPFPEMVVEFVRGTLPSTEGLCPLFGCGDSWTLYLNGDEYWLANHLPGRPEPAWLARISPGCDRVTLHCGKGMITEEEAGSRVEDPFCYPLDQILIMLYLATRGGVIVHAAGVGTNRGGCVFAGRSGAGKSTLTRQLAGRKGVRALSDDRVVIRKIDGGFRMYGTPWPGEAGIALNAWTPLRRLFFLCKSSEDRLVPLTPGEAMERLMPVVSVPWFSRELIVPQLAFLDELLAAVPAFDLHFRPTPAVAELLLA
ncbi:MAG: hypothetical protein KA419_07740 [Acidobacteria bacterium]|nr:hypothetical protein [Acidobacteriota bacterium]